MPFARSSRRDHYHLGHPADVSKGRPGSLLIQPSVRALLCSTAVFALCLIYGRNSFYRDPTSIFFDPDHAYVRWYSAVREEQSKEFAGIAAVVANTRDDGSLEAAARSKAGKAPALCVAIPTVSRAVKEQYLDITIASVLQGLTPEERADLNLQVLFATTHPEEHPTFNQIWVHDLVDSANSYGDFLFGDNFTEMALLEARSAVREKSVLDYSLALQQCYHTTAAPYIAVFEDDVILAEGWLARTILGLRDLLSKMLKDPNKTQDHWLFLRLFNQERSTGWTREIGSNGELRKSIMTGVLLYCLWRVTRSRSKLVKRHIDGLTVLVLTFIAVPSFVVLFYQAGKESVLPPGPGVVYKWPGCCSQGLVFNREQVPGLIQYLRDRRTGQYDSMTIDYMHEKDFAAFALYPMPIQHIGSYSSKGTEMQEARAVWNMAFETLDADKLQKEHAKMVKELYSIG